MSNSQLDKLKSAKGNADITLRKLVKMIGTNEPCFPHKLNLHTNGE